MRYSGRYILSLIDYARSKGADVERLCHLSEIDISHLEDSENSFTIGQVNAFWQNAIKLLDDNRLGLHIGEYHNLTAMGIVGQLVQSSPTVGSALIKAGEFMNLVTEAFAVKVTKAKEQTKVQFIPHPQADDNYNVAITQGIESAMVFTLKELKGLILAEVTPLLATFRRKVPEDIADYQRIFKCPLQFASRQSTLVFSTNQLSQKVVAADYELHNLLVEHAQRRLQELNDKNGITNSVKQAMIISSGRHLTTIQEVAGMLNLSVRTLQRRLSDEGSTFQEISQGIKKQFAVEMVANNTYLIKEIAYNLGYNEASAFIRSFKRWTGKTPVEFRASNIS